MSRYECCSANAGNAVVPMPWHEYHGTNAWHECCGVNAMAQRLWHECQSGLGIRYFAHSLFCSKSLILKCNHERFTLGCKKQAICLKNLYFLFIFDSFVPFLCQEQIAPVALSLFFKERLEWFAQVAHYKRATVCDLLRLLMTKEQLWAIRSGHSWQKSEGSDLLFFTSKLLFRSQNELIAQKTDSKFPTLMPVHECHGTNTIVKMPGCECCGVNAMSPMPRQKCCG